MVFFEGMVFVLILIALLMVKDVLWSNGMLLVPIGDFMVLIVFDNENSQIVSCEEKLIGCDLTALDFVLKKISYFQQKSILFI